MSARRCCAAAARSAARAPAPKMSPAIAGFGAAARTAPGRGRGRGDPAGWRCAIGCEARHLRRRRRTRSCSAPRRRACPTRWLSRRPAIAAATLLMRLDLAGVAASSGSACSSGKVARSHVLAAMGVAPELAAGAIRRQPGLGVARGGRRTFRRRLRMKPWLDCVAAAASPDAARRKRERLRRRPCDA